MSNKPMSLTEAFNALSKLTDISRKTTNNTYITENFSIDNEENMKFRLLRESNEENAYDEETLKRLDDVLEKIYYIAFKFSSYAKEAPPIIREKLRTISQKAYDFWFHRPGYVEPRNRSEKNTQLLLKNYDNIMKGTQPTIASWEKIMQEWSSRKSESGMSSEKNLSVHNYAKFDKNTRELKISNANGNITLVGWATKDEMPEWPECDEVTSDSALIQLHAAYVKELNGREFELGDEPLVSARMRCDLKVTTEMNSYFTQGRVWGIPDEVEALDVESLQIVSCSTDSISIWTENVSTNLDECNTVMHTIERILDAENGQKELLELFKYELHNVAQIERDERFQESILDAIEREAEWDAGEAAWEAKHDY